MLQFSVAYDEDLTSTMAGLIHMGSWLCFVRYWRPIGDNNYDWNPRSSDRETQFRYKSFMPGRVVVPGFPSSTGLKPGSVRWATVLPHSRRNDQIKVSPLVTLGGRGYMDDDETIFTAPCRFMSSRAGAIRNVTDAAAVPHLCLWTAHDDRKYLESYVSTSPRGGLFVRASDGDPQKANTNRYYPYEPVREEGNVWHFSGEYLVRAAKGDRLTAIHLGRRNVLQTLWLDRVGSPKAEFASIIWGKRFKTPWPLVNDFDVSPDGTKLAIAAVVNVSNVPGSVLMLFSKGSDSAWYLYREFSVPARFVSFSRDGFSVATFGRVNDVRGTVTIVDME